MGAVVSATVLSPGFPLVTGAVSPVHRPVLPSTHVSVPAYWTAMASDLNRSAPPGNLFVLPEDDFYQMPYTWGYYGADGFIINLIERNVVDPAAQAYTAASQQLIGAVSLVQQGLLAHDWPSVQRTLTAIGTPLLLVREDVNAAFPNGTSHRQRHSPPQNAKTGNAACPSFRRARAIRASQPIGPTAPVASYATAYSAAPDLRDLALFPAGTALISSPMRPAFPAVLQFPPVSQWRFAGDELKTTILEPPGRHYYTKLLQPPACPTCKGVCTSSTPHGPAYY